MGSQNLHEWVGRGFLPAPRGLFSRGKHDAAADIVLGCATIIDKHIQKNRGLLGRTNVRIAQILHDLLGTYHLTSPAIEVGRYLIRELGVKKLGLSRGIALLAGLGNDLKVTTHLAENLLILVTVDLGELDKGGEGLNVGELAAGRGSHKASPSVLGAIGHLGLSFVPPLGTIT